MAISIASPSSTTRPHAERSLELAFAAARTAAENRATDLVVLDLRELTSEFDYFVLATGTSRRQLHAIAEEIDNVLEKDLGDRRMGREGFDESRWILLDYGNVVIHLFDQETRVYYRLEDLWGQAPHVDLSEVVGPHAGNLGAGSLGHSLPG